jgi:hypothetical protein
MRDYNANYLLFTYEVDGVIWGQWWTAEHFLQKYPLNADKRTPEPPAEPYEHWKAAYAEQKSKTHSAKPVDLNTIVITDISKDFKNLGKILHGVGGGVGEGIGKGRGKSKIPSATPKPESDPRFAPIRQHIEKCCKHAKVPFVWDASEAKHLSDWLKATPNIIAPVETCIEYVKNRFRLAREPGERPRKWIGDLGKFATGQSNHGTNQQRQTGAVNSKFERNLKAFREATGHGDQGGSVPGGNDDEPRHLRGGDERVGGTVIEMPPATGKSGVHGADAVGAVLADAGRDPRQD